SNAATPRSNPSITAKPISSTPRISHQITRRVSYSIMTLRSHSGLSFVFRQKPGNFLARLLGLSFRRKPESILIVLLLSRALCGRASYFQGQSFRAAPLRGLLFGIAPKSNQKGLAP